MPALMGNALLAAPGTPMHHAAMAGKKEMMFALARLGCDWRARAEGIDGATAAFVLCGQHGKTTRQQARPLAASPWRSYLLACSQHSVSTLCAHSTASCRDSLLAPHTFLYVWPMLGVRLWELGMLCRGTGMCCLHVQSCGRAR